MLEDAIRQMTERFKELPLIGDILAQLRRDLPSDLIYHAYEHTEDVFGEVIRFALTDNLPEREVELLAIAAAYHDAGFIKSPTANEPIAAQMARSAMEKAGGYSAEEIKLVEQMILDTTLLDNGKGMQQVATTNLSRYLLDADLSNLGREDFFDRGELQRQELGHDRDLFRKKSYELLNSHRWLTNAARSLRQKKKEDNIQLLKKMLPAEDGTSSLSFDRLGFLAKLPLLLNSSLDTRRIIKLALEELKKRLEAEAATLFLLDESEQFLNFWALQGTEGEKLEGTKMSATKGVVGWVITHQESTLVSDVAADPRFFSDIDKEGGFKTRNMVCSPLTARGNRKLGAVQVLNKIDGSFDEEDLQFLDQFCNQMALAIENAKLFEAVQERNRQLEILDSRKSEMMSVIAHEFRTPLNLIGTSAELLSSGMLDDSKAVEKMCGILNQSVGRLTKLISEIRNLSLSTSDKVTLNITKISVQDLVREVTEAFEGPAKARNLTLHVECPDDIGRVEGDEALLLVVLRNLISNAIRFTPDQGRISVRALRSAGLIRIEVTDTGIGIPAEQLPLIFEKFYEVGNALNHSSGDLEFKSGGLGLGLATVKAILKGHDSVCEVQSTPKKGTTFAFSLPAV